MSTPVHWYLVHTKPGQERIAEFNLLRQNYQVYHPRLLRPMRHRGSWIEKIVSLFPRYIFFRLTQNQGLGPVRSTVGVANIVRFGQAYAVVPSQIVQDLRLRADPKTGLHLLRRQSHFDLGSSVRVVAGVFEGLEGIFQRESGAERIVLLLALLGRETLVEVPSGFVMPQLSFQAKLISQ